MKFTAVGDILCQKRLAEDYDGFDQIRNFIARGDARFFNLETTVHREGECYGNQFSGGTYLRCNPEIAEDMLKYGFNMTSFNNNHAMDFAHDGLLKTLENVERLGIVHAGVGHNLQQATSPAYLETKNGRVALISVNTSFHPAMKAGEQSKRIPGRPGINGVTITKKIVLPPDAFEQILQIGERCGINEATMVIRREGYIPFLPDGIAELGDLQFVRGEDYGVLYEVNAKDQDRVIRSIKEACLKADYVMVSLHTHQLVGADKSAIPEALQRFCHDLIDAGADAIVSHGPHLLRPIEIYREKPIFHSLGDFLMQLYDVEIAPEDFYAQYGLTSEASTIELLQKRSANFTRGLMADDVMLETVIPYWETDETKRLTRLELMPVKVSRDEGKMLEGLPRPAKDLSFIRRLATLSEPYGVRIRMENGVAVCEW